MLSLRKARESDLMFYFELKNDPGVRSSAFDEKTVDLETHKAWFLANLKDPSAYLFVIEVGGKPAGQIRIDIDRIAGEVDIAIIAGYRGMGYSASAIREACEQVFIKNKNLEIIFAHIKPENIASIKSFKKAGFTDGGIVNFKKNKCKELSLRQLNPGM